MIRTTPMKALALSLLLLSPLLCGPRALAAETAGVAVSTAAGKPVHDWETGAGKSYLVPALEIPGFLLSLNLYDRAKYGSEVYGTNLRTMWDHISREHWVYDKDSFKMDQFAHPYQGSMMYGFARSSGLSFWDSLLYSNAGSLLWKWGGETGDPTINDQIVTGQAGSVLGEPLFRLASMTLENGGQKPGLWREAAAAVICPPLALNRLFFGERFKPVYPQRDPATFTYLQFAGSLRNSSGGGGVSRLLDRKAAGADLHLAYGLPGKDGYKYTRPFDYFNFEFSSLSGGDTALENIMVRGLLAGEKYESGENFRGVWGLYGSYDYIAPTVFRIANTAASIGTTGQWWLSRRTALQGTLMAGPGYGGGGIAPAAGQRNYHMGATLEELAALRLIVDRKLMLDGTARSYYISGISSPDKKSSENIYRGDISLTYLVHGPHAVGLQYVESRRQSRFPQLGSSRQRESILSFAYALVFDPHFGAVEWRDGMDSGQR